MSTGPDEEPMRAVPEDYTASPPDAATVSRDTLARIAEQASRDRKDCRWSDASAVAWSTYDNGFRMLLRELTNGHVPNPHSVGLALLSAHSFSEPAEDLIRRKLMSGSKTARLREGHRSFKGGRPKGSPRQELDASLMSASAVPPSLKMLALALIDRQVRHKRGPHRLDPYDKALTSAAVEIIFSHVKENLSRERAMEDVADEFNLTVDQVREIVERRNRWKDD